LITDTKDPFAIRHYNDVDVGIRSVPQKLDDGIALRISYEHAARSAVDVSELLTGQSNCWCVNNRRHFLNMFEKKSIEEDLVIVLQSAQINVTLQIIVFSRVGLICSRNLLLQCFDVRRK
jgi:hypothetical protein